LSRYPSRIVCLTEETTETLYLLGCGERVVGISGFTVRPPEARQKPKVSTFTEAKFDRIIELHPDLVLTFSDLQADIAAELMRLGIQVVGFNQRTIEEILQMMLVVGSLVGKSSDAEVIVARMEKGLEAAKTQAAAMGRRPKVYFEEWYDPLICGICWVSELIEIAGGVDVFREKRIERGASGRIVPQEEVLARNPEIIIGSWCGKQFKKQVVRSRPGWDAIDAVHDDRLFEIRSSLILQPGPAALTDGLRELVRVIRSVC